MPEQAPPWEQLEAAAASLSRMQADIRGTVHPQATVLGTLQLGEGSTILPGTVIDGHVRIGRNCTIGPHAYVRGNTLIEDDCHIGHAVEVKSSIIRRGTHIAHLSYVGDSILEEDVNLGGGCICSNFRHDAANIRMPHNGALTDSGRNKLGCVIGAHSRIGCNCTILPGRVLPPHTATAPGTVVSRPGNKGM